MSASSDALIPVAGPRAILAGRYVGVLYELAAEQGVIDAVAADVQKLRRLWDESAEWRFVSCDPRMDSETLAQAIKEVAGASGIGALTAHFVAVLAKNMRLMLLPAVIEGYLNEVATRRGEFRADVRSATPLSEAQLQKLSESLGAIAGGKVHLSVVEDASLFGGLTVKLGAQYFDASLKTKLDHLERKLKEESAAA